MSVPDTWATTKDVTEYFQISARTWARLKRDWVEKGVMKQGKHYYQFSKRIIRYDIAEVAKLAHRMGRLSTQPSG